MEDKTIKTKTEEEKKSLRELENLRNYVHELAFFLPLAFCKVSKKNTVVGCSQAFQGIAGYQEVELIGNDVLHLFKDREKIESFLDEVSKKKSTIEEEMVLVTKEGKEVSVKVSSLASIDDDGNPSGYFLVISDITKEKRFEEELEEKINKRTEELERAKQKLQESEKILEIKVNARTRQLKEMAQDLEYKVQERTKELQQKTTQLEEKAKTEEESRVALLNLAEDLESASKEAEKEKEKTLAIVNNLADGLLFFSSDKKLALINHEAEKIFKRKSTDLLGKTPQEFVKLGKPFSSLIDIIGEDIKEVFREEASFEKDIFVEITVVSVSKEGEVIGNLVNIHDITREKNIERLKTEFVSLAAHQLRTPLAGIKWTLQTVLEEEEEAQIPEEVTSFIRKAYEANDRMVNLVNDLLNITRIEEGRYAYEPQKISIKNIIDTALMDYKESIKSRGIELNVNLPPKEEIPYIKADEEKMMLVVQNFLDNALKYTNEGEIELKVELLENKQKIKVSVSDTGVGIPEDQKERMFNKFFRAENVQRMDTEGSGLGLFISKNIVEAHGGEMGFHSEEGKGSTFFFIVPVEK